MTAVLLTTAAAGAMAIVALVGVEGITEQEAVHLNPLKQSYYVDHERRVQILASIDELVKGFMLHDRLLRAAQVRVSRQPAEEKADEPAGNETAEMAPEKTPQKTEEETPSEEPEENAE